MVSKISATDVIDNIIDGNELAADGNELAVDGNELAVSGNETVFNGYDTVKTIEVVTSAVRIYADKVRRVFPVVKAFLFGSWAKGTETEYSDVDVCFFLENFGGRSKMDILIDLSLIKLDFYWLGIEPHVLLASSLEDDEDFFSIEILKTGIEI
jgi:predicted nucleotidyltransferase